MGSVHFDQDSDSRQMSENSSTILADAQRLMEQGRYSEALKALDDVGWDDPRYGEAVEWAARACCEKGRLGEANERLHRAILHHLPEPASLRCRLWLAHTQLYGVGRIGALHPWDAFQIAANDAQASTDALTRALAADLRGRGVALRVGLGWDPPPHRRRAIELMEQATVAYLAAGAPKEAVRARLRLSYTCQSLPYGNPVRARQELEGAVIEAIAISYGAAEADARLAMAEHDWDKLLASCEAGVDQAAWREKVEQVAALYREVGHTFGEAKAVWTFSRVMLKYGYSEGVEIARRAAQMLAVAGEDLIQQEIWKSLHLWHTAHGSPAEALEARQLSEHLNQGMAFPLAVGVDQLASADAALRAGRYGEAEQRLRDIIQESAYRDVHLSARMVLANVLSRAARRTDAIATISAVIEDLERAGGSVLLPDALDIRVMLTFDSAPNEAEIDFDRLISLDRMGNDPVAEAKHRLERAWTHMESNRRGGRSPVVTTELEAEFGTAEAILRPLRTLEARKQLGKLYERRGHGALLDRQWDKCAHWFVAAENTFRALELRPDLAFTLMLQGLVMVHVGREKGPRAYDVARDRFAEAERLVRESGLSGMLWNTLFYQGICDREQGSNWERSGGMQQQIRWASAEKLFLEASRIIDVQRGSLFGDTDQAGQVVRIDFALDKQVVYHEGFQLAAFLRQDFISAVQWLERMKGRAALDALASAPLKLPADRPPHPMIALDQGLRQRKLSVVTFPEAETLQRQIDENLEKMTADPNAAAYAALRRADPPSWGVVREALQEETVQSPGRRLIVAQFHHGTGQPILFGLRADWDSPRMSRLSVDSAQINAFSEFCFGDGNGGSRLKNERLDSEWAKFAPLVAPLIDWAEPGDRVVLIPHKELHNLPLHTLPVAGTTLGDRNLVTYSPSLSVFYHLLHRHRGSAPSRLTRAATFGDPTNDRRSIRTAVVEAARQEYFLSEPKLGEEVTRDRILAGLEQSDHFLYAGHGEFEFADGMRSGLRLANGVRLTAGDIFGLRHTASLVVLSGCVTGVHERRDGDELLGMVRALLLKGTDAVVASQWKVPEEATGQLIRALAACLSGGASVAEAMQEACKVVRDETGRSHPYYWGGFVVYGFG